MYGSAQREYVSTAETEYLGPSQWYAVHTFPRHEQKVARRLTERGVPLFLPLVHQTHYWSDRRKVVELPLFPCYTFVHIPCTAQNRSRVLTTPGVLRFVSFKDQPAAVPEDQIEAVRKVLANNLPFSSHGFLKVGQRVRIRGGCLDGVEGTLVGHNGGRRLVVSVDLIQQSLAISLEGYEVEPA